MANSKESSDMYTLPSDCDFSRVKNNVAQKSECSPQLTDPLFSEFTGLLINSAEEIIWPNGVEQEDYITTPSGNTNSPLRFMVSGLINIPVTLNDKLSDFSKEVIIVAVDETTKHVYSGKMMPLGNVVSNPDVLSSTNDLPRTEYFNIDLVINAKVPVANATYVVYATYKEYKSNVLIVKTRIKK